LNFLRRRGIAHWQVNLVYAIGIICLLNEMAGSAGDMEIAPTTEGQHRIGHTCVAVECPYQQGLSMAA
jgi:hypothetical protein